MAVDTQILDALKQAAGDGGWSEDAAEIAPYLSEWRDLYHGRSPLLLKPADAKAVSRILKIANTYKIAIVPQGGNTGLVGGGVPDDSGREILLSLKRMDKIRSLDARGFSMVAEAGVPLATVQQAAADAGRLFPLSLASEGSATIGGLVSTNAGGVHVLRYGTMRALTLGLEAVLPTGEIIDDLSALYKDNTGYDLSGLLIGAEGTLGVITAATLRLYPCLAERATALVSLSDPDKALSLFSYLRSVHSDELIAFELMQHFGLQLVCDHMEGCRMPFQKASAWYALVELASSKPDAQLDAGFDASLAKALEAGTIEDALVARSLAQGETFWRLRHNLSEAQKHAGGSIKHDISLPLDAVPRFIEETVETLNRHMPGVRPCIFGHMGDGNLHFNLSQPLDMDKDAFLAQWGAINRIVHDKVAEMGGSISAEHGIGRMKVEEMARLSDPTSLAAMKRIKRALDPNSVLNPGRIFRL